MPSRFEAIKANLRRRDNIRYFVEGLEDSECWPYLEHQNGAPVAANFFSDEDGKTPVFFEVAVRRETLDELTILHLPNVKRTIGRHLPPSATLVDLAIELTPEDGSGAYTLDYEIVEEPESRDKAPLLYMNAVNELRSAFMHRYEWVASKVHSVNLARQAAVDEMLCEPTAHSGNGPFEAVPGTIGCNDAGNEESLSEEEDFASVRVLDFESSRHC